MKRIKLELLFPDNGGVVMHHNPDISGSKSATGYNPRQKLYMSASLDPLEVGTTLMAMMADLRMTEADVATAVDLDREVGEITF